MEQVNFIDFKAVSAEVIHNRSLLNSGKKFSLMQCKWMQFSEDSNIVKVKTTLDDAEFDLLCVHEMPGIDVESLRCSMVPMYNKQLPISKAKHNDLQFLCKKLVIPEEFHSFYNSLTTSDIPDKLDETDVEEKSDEGDDCDDSVVVAAMQVTKKRSKASHELTVNTLLTQNHGKSTLSRKLTGKKKLDKTQQSTKQDITVKVNGRKQRQTRSSKAVLADIMSDVEHDDHADPVVVSANRVTKKKQQKSTVSESASTKLPITKNTGKETKTKSSVKKDTAVTVTGRQYRNIRSAEVEFVEKIPIVDGARVSSVLKSSGKPQQIVDNIMLPDLAPRRRSTRMILPKRT